MTGTCCCKDVYMYVRMYECMCRCSMERACMGKRFESLHDLTWQYSNWQYVIWLCMILHFMAWRHDTVYLMSWHVITQRYITLHGIGWHYMSVHDVTSCINNYTVQRVCMCNVPKRAYKGKRFNLSKKTYSRFVVLRQENSQYAWVDARANRPARACGWMPYDKSAVFQG